jgi:hypothetical protein
MTYEEWKDEAVRRFGPDPLDWKFVCPSCGYVASVKEWKDSGASEGEIAVSCVGRALGSRKKVGTKTGGPCNYAGYGLLRLNPVRIELDDHTVEAFAFAESEPEGAAK